MKKTLQKIRRVLSVALTTALVITSVNMSAFEVEAADNQTGVQSQSEWLDSGVYWQTHGDWKVYAGDWSGTQINYKLFDEANAIGVQRRCDGDGDVPDVGWDQWAAQLKLEILGGLDPSESYTFTATLSSDNSDGQIYLGETTYQFGNNPQTISSTQDAEVIEGTDVTYIQFTMGLGHVEMDNGVYITNARVVDSKGNEVYPTQYEYPSESESSNNETSGSESESHSATTRNWESFWGADMGWYEGSLGLTTNITNTGFDAYFEMIGWGGVYGCQIYDNTTVNIPAGQEWLLKASITSDDIDKWIFIQFSNDYDGWNSCVGGKWIYLKKGETTYVEEHFTFDKDVNKINFCMGGEFGDRNDESDIYALTETTPNDGVEGVEADAYTTIHVRNFVLEATGNETPTEEISSEEKSTDGSLSPEDPLGLTILRMSNSEVTFTWSVTKNQLLAGYVYNVYYDDEYYDTYLNPRSITAYFSKPGIHKITVKSSLNGVMSGGVSTYVTIGGNSIESISFIPATPIIIPEESGEWVETNINGTTINYYHYDYNLFTEDSCLKIYYEDGSNKSYYYRENNGSGYFISEDDDYIFEDEVHWYDNQYYEAWDVDTSNQITIEYLGKETTVNAVIAGESMSLGTINLDEVTDFECDGSFHYFEFTPEEDGYYIFYSTGNDDTYGYIYDSALNVLATDDDEGDRYNFLAEYYMTAGDTYMLRARFYDSDESGTIKVIVAKSNRKPAAFISYTPANPIEIIENTNGYWDDEYFYYYYGNYIPNPGDTLEVTYEDGETTTYVYSKYYYYDNEYNWEFIDSSGQRLIGYPNYSSDQSEDNPWTLDNPGVITIEYEGAQTSVPAVIVENPVESISYIPVEKISIYENTNGYLMHYYDDYDNDLYYFYYNAEDFTRMTGDVLNIYYKDGHTESYTFGRYPDGESGWHWAFVDDSGNELEEYVGFYNDQDSENQWTVGNTYYVTVFAYGKTTTIPISIVENPVAGIVFTPTAPIQIMENTDGDFVHSGYDKFYRYTFENFIRSEGNKLTIEYKDGTSEEYVCGKYYPEDEDYYVMRFINASGDALDDEIINLESHQYEDHWLAGNTYEVDLEYMGYTVKVPMTILESPIESISYASPTVAKLINHTNGWYNYYNGIPYFHYDTNMVFCLGDTLTVNYKDGASETYTYQEYNYGNNYIGRAFVSMDGQLLEDTVYTYSDQDYYNQWTPGSTYPVTIMYLGKSDTVYVDVVEEQTEVVGFQISAVNDGMRIVYSTSSSEQITSRGIIVGLDEYTDDDEMTVGSDNPYVYSYEASNGFYGYDGDGNSTYVMTLKNIRSAEYLSARLKFRTYIEKEDGTYIYSEIYDTSVFEVADYLYSNKKMPSEEGHDYLYNDILSLVDGKYAYIEY